ncbi:hypothetical protein, variant 3 [Plasmodium yoelii 17X]|uniref:Transmembrane protein n=1 Tax=Plasmodium yoelii 17X TaxID=1323249 RepID=V7PEZ4_PLAYE|nr:hypothetical protein YYC_04184 [Plasmodium yoelii 17X]ETB58102.1 hypothetical protein, variant 1 [Plasmodium yoelii 17X]ETB58103.1 hypothetical protein, variant 2 [Plasmodium yoelii 17X]ETB58104.1 hypothetical protein, variant 3 [Plasmodium yoelii 17X]
MPDNLELLHFYNIYNDRRNKWKIGINKLNLNIENYKNMKTKIFLYVLWSILLFIYFFEFLLNLLFLKYIQNINIIIKIIFIFSISEFITIILLTTQSIYGYLYDSSLILQKASQSFFILSVWCFIKLLFYIILIILLSAFLNSNIILNTQLLYFSNQTLYFNYLIKLIITITAVKFVLTFFTGQKINYVFSCIRTSIILKNKIRKDLEKKSFLFEDQTYGTFTMNFNV